MKKNCCRLCGGKLHNGICSECGMDNRKSDDMYHLNRNDNSQGVTFENAKGTTPQEYVQNAAGRFIKRGKSSGNNASHAQYQKDKLDGGSRKYYGGAQNAADAEARRQNRQSNQTYQKAAKQYQKVNENFQKQAQYKEVHPNGNGYGSAQSGYETAQSSYTKNTLSQQILSQGSATQKKPKRSGTRIVIVIVVVVFVLYLLSGIIGSVYYSIKDSVSDGIGSDEYSDDYLEEEYDPYEYLERDFEPGTGEYYQTELVPGFYTVGVDIPEGRYNVSVVSGSGYINVDDEENSIYFYSDLSEDGQTTDEDYRLFDGAVVYVEGRLVVSITADNARTDTITAREINPLAETVELTGIDDVDNTTVYEVGVDIPAGTYDVELIKGDYTYIESTWPDDYYGSYSSLWLDMEEDEAETNIYKNVEFVAGESIRIMTEATVKLTPSQPEIDTDAA
ncbi:MAG: hypothetical protein PHC41_09895 [Lachnospiraceae bacterium]|jgi:hypothetical protein|nr:hypothetical protein [Lachnospiraceae bacterium]MDD3616522.1 hypothetical protein [Lachnospiraceae bacterium]